MKTIMVVDDEASVLDNVKSCLEDDYFRVITADNNREALELMEQSREDEFGLILINSIMPGSNRPALFSMKPESKKDIDTSNEKDFLQKPFTKEQLIDFVKQKI